MHPPSDRGRTARAAIRLTGIATACWTLVLASPSWAQYREYYVRGKVVDVQKQPIPEVEIQLRDLETSRTYHMKTGRDGTYKFAGLPHAVYEVTMTKAGYPPTKLEWKLVTPQETMQRVEMPDIVLAPQQRVRKDDQVKDAEAGVKQAAEMIRQGDLDGAIALLRGLLEKDPKDPTALFYLGLSYTAKKMYNEAIGAFTQVTEQTSRFPAAYFELGVCYRGLGDLPKALEAYDKGLELDPANADGLYNSGLILFETNRIDEALARFESGLASNPEDPEILEMVGRCYIHQAKFDTALGHLEKARARSTDPGKQKVLDQLIGTLRSRVR